MTLDHNAVCENCWYWETITTGHEVLGFCKRYAPIVVTSPPDPGSFASFTTTTLWPRTVAEDWCGDWEKNIPKMEMASNPVPLEKCWVLPCFEISRCVCGGLPNLQWVEQSGLNRSYSVSCSCGKHSAMFLTADVAFMDWENNLQKP